MQGLSEHDLLFALLALAILLVFARGAGELARRIGQPEVLGEFFAGFVLGPSIIGALLPGIYKTIFLNPSVDFVLSGLSWLGAILLLLVAGIEVDVAILRAEAKPGALAAAGAIIPSIIAGTLFAMLVLGRPMAYAFFLGIVLSVTAVSVAAKIMIEREILRRRYAQVILAAGVASEVLVWLMVSVVSAAHEKTPLLAIRSTLFAIGFFIVMLTLGRRFTFWAMRRVADSTHIVKGQLTLVLVLMLLSATLTHAMGLHPLLGAFVFGVLLSQAPRTNRPLVESIQTLTSSLFAPIFFVLAGMRVNIFQLSGFSAIGTILLLLVVATVVKAGLGAAGARLGGLSRWEAGAVGVGLNMKGGTDVIVAIVGVELGLFSQRTYTLYAVVAILTVFLSPPLLTFFQKKAAPTPAETERLQREEAAQRSYVPRVERVLVPLAPQLLPALVADVVESIATAKHAEHQIFDITEFVPTDELNVAPEAERATVAAASTLGETRTLDTVEVQRRQVDVRHTLKPILDISEEHDLIAIGAHPRAHRTTVSFGRLQDAIIQRAQSDILMLATAQRDEFDAQSVKRILVPTNGLEYSMAAGDIAAYLAKANDAELVLYHTVSADMDALFWREQDHHRVRRVGYRVVDELEFRVKRLGVRVECRVVVSATPGSDIVRELATGGYQLVVLGAFNRIANGRPYLGGVVRAVLAQSQTPALVLVSQTNPRETRG